jgi:prepilin-type N-terminal cleavage/methylation domain-containing protein
MKHPLNDSRGFTLTELVMAVAVGLVLLAAVMTAIVSGQRSATGIERKVTTNQDARAALEIMAAEIRMASFNSTFEPNLWRNPGDCSVSGNQNWRGIQEATATSITVEMDIESPNPSTVCGDTSGEIIRYEASSHGITRHLITCVSGVRNLDSQPFLGPIAGHPEVRTVECVNCDFGHALPVFRYFDGTGAEILHANLPNDIPRIRRIEIALLVRSADIDPNTGRQRQMAYSTSVMPRNHGIQF